MGETKQKVTLIGSILARQGLEFVYEGMAPECSSCSVAKACGNLKAGRRYRITGVRAATHPCAVHEGGATAVEVEEAAVQALLSAEMAIRNSRIRFEASCNREDCGSYPLCCPDGVITGESYIVSTVIGTPDDPCRKGRTLKLVELRPA